ncbi:alanine racemase [Deinococcus sp. Marseille-Q6407]|uniref:alanine racemase n=1 Tax=Deinococcus sp. Marseille-Q6407 TaxID=2969223 RepID=UPI0021BFA0E6|nr:alanine racemase [Deinococcus sp. Marseille-Q6407]
MAFVTLNRDKLAHNYAHLQALFAGHNIDWGVVTKLFCGNELFIGEVLRLGVREVLDSRISNLRVIKRLCPEAQTVYIKPPAWDYVEDLVRWADVSFNTELETLRLISDEAVRQGRVHKVIIMIEMGDLREGVMREDLDSFYAQVFGLPGIEVIGIGTNLNCLSGVMPSEDKLIQLGLYRTILELKNGVKIPWVSAGTTVTLPLLKAGLLPASVNHFRVGEALYFGADLVREATFEDMYDDVLELHAQVIELSEKPMNPSGPLGKNPFGATADSGYEQGATAYRAILDVGYLDVSPQYLILEDESLGVLDASSDMLVLDAGENAAGLKVGDHVRFRLKYMGALHLMNSDYIGKVVVNGAGDRLDAAPIMSRD